MTRAVLVVDDSPFSRRVLIKYLPPTLRGDVTQARDGAEALAILRARPHHLVILDLNMPVMNGYQLLEALRGTELPAVIVLSGDIQPLAQERVMALGARAFVKKPIRAEALAQVLAELGLS